MPSKTLQSFAKKSGKSIDTIEKYEKEAKASAKKQGHEDDWAYIMGIVKRRAGLTKKEEQLMKEHKIYTAFFHKLFESNENYGELDSLVKSLTQWYPVQKLWVIERTYGILIKALIIDSEYQEQGYGTKVMQELIRFANERNQPIAVSPIKQKGTSINRLTSWLKDMGFVANKGKERDFRLPETYVYKPVKPSVAEEEETEE